METETKESQSLNDLNQGPNLLVLREAEIEGWKPGCPINPTDEHGWSTLAGSARSVLYLKISSRSAASAASAPASSTNEVVLHDRKRAEQQ